MDDEKTSVITVSELSDSIKNFVDNFDKKIRVIGEISNCSEKERATYFTLKDENGVIDGIFWNPYKSVTSKNKDKKLQIKNGLKVMVTGDIVVYRSTIQIKAYEIENAGIGDLEKKYQKLKENFEKSGYFDQSRKKILPKKLRKIGIATSASGAALQDILHVLKREKFYGEIFIRDCRVQGENCPQSVCEALSELDGLNVDIIMIARGGGSYEDLFGFSDESVVEAIFKCKTFVISAIGHETDKMLSDFVADFRAPTPSIAAETICRSQKEELKYILDNNYLYRFQNVITNYLRHVERSIPTIESPIEKMAKGNDLDNILESTKIIVRNILSRRMNKYDSLSNRLSSSNQKNILSQGYCMLVDENGNTIKSANEFNNYSGKMMLLFTDGSVKVMKAMS